MTTQEIKQQIESAEKGLNNALIPESFKPALRQKKADLEKALADLETAETASKKLEVKIDKVEKALPTTPAAKEKAKEVKTEIKKEIAKEKPVVAAKVEHAKKSAKKAVAEAKDFLSKLPAKVKSFNAGRSQGEIARDKTRSAAAPGKRTSASGGIYYEGRPNRSDVDQRVGLAKGGYVDEFGKKYLNAELSYNNENYYKGWYSNSDDDIYPVFDFETAKKILTALKYPFEFEGEVITAKLPGTKTYENINAGQIIKDGKKIKVYGIDAPDGLSWNVGVDEDFAKGGQVGDPVKDAAYVVKCFGPIVKSLLSKGYFGKKPLTNSWSSGGGFKHFAIQRPDKKWLLFSNVDDTITLSEKTYDTAEEVYDDFWENENAFVKHIDATDDKSKPLPTAKVVKEIIDGKWKDVFAKGGVVGETEVKKWLYDKLKESGVDVADFKHKVAQLKMDLQDGCHEDDYEGWETTKDKLDEIFEDHLPSSVYYDNETGQISEYEPDYSEVDEETGEPLEGVAEWHEVDCKNILFGNTAEYFAKGGAVKKTKISKPEKVTIMVTLMSLNAIKGKTDQNLVGYSELQKTANELSADPTNYGALNMAGLLLQNYKDKLPNADIDKTVAELKAMGQKYYALSQGKSFAKGGRLKSALMRDRKYLSQQQHEQAYNNSVGGKRKGYMAKGGKVIPEFTESQHRDSNFNPLLMTEEKATQRLKELSREDLIEILRWNDRNGIYNDEDSIAEFGHPATKQELVDSFWRTWEEPEPESETDPSYSGEGTNINVFGYQTKNFDIAPEAVEQITNARDLITKNYTGQKYDEAQRALTSLTTDLDKIFGIQKSSGKKGYAGPGDIYEVTSLVSFAGIYNMQAGMVVDLHFLSDHIFAIAMLVQTGKGFARGGHITDKDWDGLSPHEKEIFNYLKNYFFLLEKPGVYTYTDLANRIKETYDISSGRNKVVYDALMEFPESEIEKFPDGSTKYATGGVVKYPDLSTIPQTTVIAENGANLFTIPEIDIKKIGVVEVQGSKKITSIAEAVEILKDYWDKDKIKIQEQMNVLFLNKSNVVTGIYQHSTGGVDATVADVEIIAAIAVKSLSKGVIIAHNHPSDSVKPSRADEQLSKRLKEALNLFQIVLVDSIIITPSGETFSLTDNGMLASGGRLKSALNRDRKYTSSEEWEKDYNRKGGPRHYMFEGGEIENFSNGFTIKQMRDFLDKELPDSFSFAVYPVKADSRQAMVQPDMKDWGGLKDSDIKADLYFGKVKDRDFAYHVFQGGENTYFHFALMSDSQDGQYIGTFGFKDQGDVSVEYINKFVSILHSFAGIPFQVHHSVYAKGGRLKSALNRDRKYTSSEEWEQDYDRKGGPRHYMKNGGTVRSVKDYQKLLNEKKAIVNKLTPKEIQEMWNGLVPESFMSLHQASDNGKVYLKNLLVEKELNEEEYNRYFKNGGRLKSALNRDRKYTSSEEWEKDYNRKGGPRHYMAKGGKVSSSPKEIDVRTSNGEITMDGNTGKVLNVVVDPDEDDMIQNIDKFDINEYKKYHKVKVLPSSIDILDLGYWMKDGTYEEPAQDWREMIADMEKGNYAAGGKIKSKKAFYDAAAAYLKKYYLLDPNDGFDKIESDRAFEQGETPEEFIDDIAERHDLDKVGSGPWGMAKGGTVKTVKKSDFLPSPKFKGLFTYGEDDGSKSLFSEQEVDLIVSKAKIVLELNASRNTRKEMEGFQKKHKYPTVLTLTPSEYGSMWRIWKLPSNASLTQNEYDKLLKKKVFEKDGFWYCEMKSKFVLRHNTQDEAIHSFEHDYGKVSMAKGGRTTAATNKDRKYTNNSQDWETNYKRIGATHHYLAAGGKIKAKDFKAVDLAGKQVWRTAPGRNGVYDILSVHKISDTNIKVAIKEPHAGLIITESYSTKQLLDLANGKKVNGLEIMSPAKKESGGMVDENEFPLSEQQRLIKIFLNDHSKKAEVIGQLKEFRDGYTSDKTGGTLFGKPYTYYAAQYQKAMDYVNNYEVKAKGGKVTFNDKVKAVSKSLTGKPVPAKYQAAAGKKYSKKEAVAAAKKIVGSMVKK
jgi:hypothetical protein